MLTRVMLDQDGVTRTGSALILITPDQQAAPAADRRHRSVQSTAQTRSARRWRGSNFANLPNSLPRQNAGSVLKAWISIRVDYFAAGSLMGSMDKGLAAAIALG